MHGKDYNKQVARRQRINSFRLGHHHQVKGNKPWGKRQKRPLVPKDKKDAQKIIRLVLQKVGVPPLEFIYQLLNNPKGGALS